MHLIPLKICMDATAHVVDWTCIAHVRVKVAAFWQLNVILDDHSCVDNPCAFFGEDFAQKPLR